MIKADRTHNDGKQTHERPSQRPASGGVPATIQMPKAMIPIEMRNENAAFMLASIPKKSVQPKSGI